jgi:hypothetical protein
MYLAVCIGYIRFEINYISNGTCDIFILVETPWTRSYHELTGIVMPFYGAIQCWLI